jgi:diguanylate cyclase (GGDEF)-like protein
MQKRFEEVIQFGGLPTPSGVGLVILRRTQDEECSLEELLHCIEADPSLSGRLLKLANSTGRSNVDPVATMQQAVTCLGAAAIRSVALSFTLVPAKGAGACTSFDYDRYWSHSLAAALAAQIIAGERGVIDPAEAYTCALLARVGMLALASAHPDTYTHILEEHVGKTPAELLSAESRAFDIQHWEVAAALMADWGLPEFYASAVLSLARAEDEPDDADLLTSAMSDVLRESSQVADALLATLEHADWPLGARWIELMAPAGSIACDHDRLAPVIEQIEPAWRSLGTLFRLPTSKVATNEVADASAARALQDTNIVSDVNRTLMSAASHEAIAALPPGEIKVLAIDDDPRILRLLVHHLRQAGYSVQTAENGERGLQLALEESPHIVVTDLVMPDITGIDLCRALRRVDAGRRTYVLILTAREDEQQVVEAFSAGADDYVTKPFNPRILLARVQAGQRMIELQRQVEADRKVRMGQVAEMGLLTRKLRAAALTDILTELPNRRYAITRLEKEWRLAVQTNRPLSVVMIDIDHFKRINDTYGHAAGDAVLRETANVLRHRTRRGDVVCRLGGEEFLVINVSSGIHGAIECAERLRSAVEANRVTCGGFDGTVSISLGCAERAPTMRDVDDLLKAADEAVYVAKAAGRNTVRPAYHRLPETG